MTFRWTDPHGDHLEAEADAFDNGEPALYIETSGSVRVPLDRVEELIAGIRDTARQAAHQPCTCTDSARSRIGYCPLPGDREYDHCPQRTARRAAKEQQ
jgi:hypothetical protein